MTALALDPSQQLAAELICTADVGVVTGGPGTGKTTTLRTALDMLDAMGSKYRLAAPTGKASLRMQQATGREASTIHRLLEFHPVEGWRRNVSNPIDASLVVVDEASMVDVELGAALFRAIGPDTRLVLVGDADQLPPVGPGRVFGDLVESGAVPVARLTTLHRSAHESWIHVSAQQILKGEMPALTPRADFRFVELDDAADILPAVQKLITDVIPREIDTDAQVLIPQRPGVAGIEAANIALQNTLNPKREGEPFLKRKDHELRVGDRVIQTRNDYKLDGGAGVFNGEIGDVVDVSTKGAVVQYQGRQPVVYTLDQSNALQLAYALTVHRSQGSEWPWVVVVCHSTHTFILSRQLIYTAITRAKKGVILVGDRKGLKAAVNAKDPPKRNTGLIERLKGEIAA